MISSYMLSMRIICWRIFEMYSKDSDATRLTWIQRKVWLVYWRLNMSVIKSMLGECILQKRSWVKKLLLFVTPQGAKRLRSWRNTFLHMYRNNTLCSFSNKEYKNISKVHNSNTPNLVRWSSDVLSLVQCFMMVEANEVTGASPEELYSAIWYSWIIGVFSCHNLQNLSMLK